jgi:hypothetical protein
MGKSEDAVKMQMYRTVKRLRARHSETTRREDR